MKFSMEPVSQAASMGPVAYSKDSDADGLVTRTDNAGRALAMIGHRFEDIEVTGAGSLLVTGAIHGFFQDRAEAIGRATRLVEQRCAATREALVFIDAGDEEMAVNALSAARKAD